MLGYVTYRKVVFRICFFCHDMLRYIVYVVESILSSDMESTFDHL